MKIGSIGARNFRTLEHFSLDLKPNYCAISGRNNAGKSAIIRIIDHFLSENSNDYFFPTGDRDISFPRDVTQWADVDEMEISVDILVERENDSEIFFVVKTYSKIDIGQKDSIVVRLSEIIAKDNTRILKCTVDGEEIDGPGANQIFKKFRSSSSLVVHNSTKINRNLYFSGGSYTEVLENHFDQQDRARINDAQTRLQNSLKKAAKQHRDKLEQLLGKLTEKYQVELSALNSSRSTKWPLEIKLTDKNVAVPLNDWGSGTQNRTKILMSVLDAIRMRSSASNENRCTPVFLVEEPESFLHPSAQADFGRVLNSLATEFEIQIIATTHSPYMLNQADPQSNYLIERRIFRGAMREASVRDTGGDDWMVPFAENLGVVPSEFKTWKSIFAGSAARVILVEGDIDKQYFDIFRQKYPEIYQISDDVDVIPYNGKDSLKNTALLRFMINRLGKVFITFDKDASGEVIHPLQSIGLLDGKDYCAVGLDEPGKDCIEGLLPESVKSKVFGAHTDLVMAISSADAKARKRARSTLKAKLLEEFRMFDGDPNELAAYRSIFLKIQRGLSS